MANNNMHWNKTAQIGNTTRAKHMAHLICHMKWFQTQRRGMASHAQRPLTNSEFQRVMETYWLIPNSELGLVGAAVSKFQLSMIGHQDDIIKFREADLQPYSLYHDYGVVGRLPWSKNVTDERDAPSQVIFGAMDTRYDFLSNSGLRLGYHYSVNLEDNEFVFGYDGLDDPIQIKERLSCLLGNTLQNADFNLGRPCLVGTHSIMKMEVSFAWGNGCSKVCCFLFYINIIIFKFTFY